MSYWLALCLSDRCFICTERSFLHSIFTRLLRVSLHLITSVCVLPQDNDGGMTAQLPSTMTSFMQSGLRPGEEYTVNLVALRDQGRSQPVTATVTMCMYQRKH